MNCDIDGDGYKSEYCGGDDCDDKDRWVHPDANELYNGRDDNCDGLKDNCVLGDMDCDKRITAKELVKSMKEWSNKGGSIKELIDLYMNGYFFEKFSVLFVCEKGRDILRFYPSCLGVVMVLWGKF